MPTHRPHCPPSARLVFAGLTLMLGLGGCWDPGYKPGGSMASRDLFTYPSTPDFPQNLVLRDWTTNEELLTVEIPVGQQLVIRFFEDHDPKNTARPALVRWKLMPLGTQFGELDNSMPVPDFNHRRVDTFIRGKAEAVPKPAPVPPPEAVSPK